MSNDPDHFHRAAGEAARRWGSLTPYRIGLILGERGLRVNPPADKSERWRNSLLKGIQEGTSVRKSAIIVADTATLSLGKDEAGLQHQACKTKIWREIVKRSVQVPGYRVATIQGAQDDTELTIVLKRIGG